MSPNTLEPRVVELEERIVHLTNVSRQMAELLAVLVKTMSEKHLVPSSLKGEVDRVVRYTQELH